MSLQQPSGIVTPEAVLLEFDTAGVGSRTAAELLDVLIQVVILGAIGLAASFLAGAVGGSSGTIAVIILLISALLIIVGYPLAFESLWGGRTLGKAALGLRVVTVEGGPVRVRQSASRAIVGVFELWMTFGSVAVLTTILTRDNQRLGDLVGGTLVLRERTAASTAATAMSFPAPYGYADYVASIDVSVLTSDQYGVIRTFLMRVLDLTAEARASLAVKLANATALELHHTPPSNVPPELFLVCVASAYQARHGGVTPGPTWAPTPSYGPQPIYGQAPGSGQHPTAPPPPGYGAPSYGQPGYGPPTYGQPGHGPQGPGQPAFGQAPSPPVGPAPAGWAPPPAGPPATSWGAPTPSPPASTAAPTPGPPASPAPAGPPGASPPWPSEPASAPPAGGPPPRFDTPPATPAEPVAPTWPPAPPPRFDTPPTAAPASPTPPAEAPATPAAEPAPWPPRKPGLHPDLIAEAEASAAASSSPDQPASEGGSPTDDG